MSVRRRGPRAPGVVYGGLTMALLVFVASLAMTQQQPPPPSIAEFSPQAQERIEEAPEEQTSDFGAGDGGAPTEERPTPPPEPEEAAPSIDVPRVRSCVGDPPRQIEDPQSPSCVPYWEGDNGGSTTKGVTGDEIRVIGAQGGEGSYQRIRTEVALALERFLNSRFEFYGRTFRLILTDYGTTNEAVDARAQATQADEEHQVFASTHFMFGVGAYHYHDELANRGIVSVRGPDQNVEESILAAKRPYLWSYIMAVDRILSNVGEWTCKRLAGGEAVHGGPGVNSRARVFGIVTTTYIPEQVAVSPEPLERELARCGEEAALTLVNPVSEPPDTEGWRNIVLQMKDAGVTSILCVCTWLDSYGLKGEADRQIYYPEWLVSSYGFNDSSISANYGRGFGPGTQQQYTLGLTFQPRQLRFENEPVVWAVGEADPNVDIQRGGFDHWSNRDFYRSLLLLASGIQMAGPNLTPETFERALHQTVFPNPDHFIMAGKVGFAGHSYSMTTDGAEWWWSETDSDPYGDGVGTLCYVNGGERHEKGEWPSGSDPLFEPPCDAAV